RARARRGRARKGMNPTAAPPAPTYTRAGLESSFEPVATRRTFEEAVEQIAERVKSGDLVVGDRLPSERELAALMRISRPTLREAVKVLAEAGVLEVRRGQSGGTFVASELVPRGPHHRGAPARPRRRHSGDAQPSQCPPPRPTGAERGAGARPRRGAPAAGLPPPPAGAAARPTRRREPHPTERQRYPPPVTW